MKKIILITTGVLSLGAATTKAQIGISPEVGINFANQHQELKYPVTGGTYTKKYDGGIKLGLKVGANVDIAVGDHLDIQPGVFYSIQGSKGDASVVGGTGTSGTETHNYTIHYIQVPVNVQYLFNDPGEGRFFVGLGGYYGIAIGGQDKQTATNGTKTSTSIEFSAGSANTYGALQRSDFGVAGNVGYLLKSGIFFRGMYQLGLSNLQSNGDDDNYFKNTNITASVGYTLRHKKVNAPKSDAGSGM